MFPDWVAGISRFGQARDQQQEITMLSFHKAAPGPILALAVLATMASAAFASGALAADGAPATNDDFAKALARAQAENKPLVLDFFTDW